MTAKAATGNFIEMFIYFSYNFLSNYENHDHNECRYSTGSENIWFKRCQHLNHSKNETPKYTRNMS